MSIGIQQLFKGVVVFIVAVVYFVIGSVRKGLDTPSRLADFEKN
jgi:hypothetical protein